LYAIHVAAVVMQELYDRFVQGDLVVEEQGIRKVIGTL
jgi:hypothetical protein